MDRRALAVLADLADRALKGDLARLAALRAARLDLEGEMGRLRDAALDQARQNADIAALAAYAGWRDWAAGRHRRLEAEDRSLETQMEAVRRRAVANLGRCEAVGILDQRSAAADLEIERRRSERDGRPPDR